MHDDHPPNKPAGQLVTAPRIRRLMLQHEKLRVIYTDSSAYTEINGTLQRLKNNSHGQLRVYGD